MAVLSNKIAIVTGAGRGPGRAAALALGQAGATVMVVDINPDHAQQTVDAITQAGGAALLHVIDVSNKLAVQTMLYTVLEQSDRIDVLVNSARVTPSNSALKMDEWEWNRSLDVNLKGAFLVSQTVARAMKETGGGTIFNVIRPTDEASHVAVRAARDGLLGLSAALATEWGGFGIRVKTLLAANPQLAAQEVVNLLSAA